MWTYKYIMNIIFFIFLQCFLLIHTLDPTNFGEILQQRSIENLTSFVLLSYREFLIDKAFLFGGLKDGIPTNDLYELTISPSSIRYITQLLLAP